MGTFGTWSDPGRVTHLVVAPFRSHEEIALYPGCRVVKANCGHFAWLSRAGEPYLARCYTVCEDCIGDLATAAATASAVKGALASLRREHGEVMAERVAKMMEQRGMAEDE